MAIKFSWETIPENPSEEFSFSLMSNIQSSSLTDVRQPQRRPVAVVSAGFPSQQCERTWATKSCIVCLGNSRSFNY